MSSILVFPGQGAQRPGMLQSVCAQTMSEASEVLGEDAWRLDSIEALNSTRAVQLCLLIAGVGASRALSQHDLKTDFVAGLSIGAYPAAVAAGALRFDDALRLVSLRGTLMQDAYPHGYGMTAILGLDVPAVERILREVQSEDAPVYLANINADNQVVIAGSDDAMTRVARLAKERGAGLAKRLAVSVPSHCLLLQEPAQSLAKAFQQVQLATPSRGYISGSSARRVIHIEALRHDLAFNMCRLVDWRGAMQNALERGVRLHLEAPPGAVLTNLGRRVFGPGCTMAFDTTRMDTVEALLRKEEAQPI